MEETLGTFPDAEAVTGNPGGIWYTEEITYLTNKNLDLEKWEDAENTTQDF